MGRFFGTDGIRGVAGRDLTDELARSVGTAVVAVLGRHGVRRPLVVVGRDTRASGRALEQALVEGIRAGGGDALVAGIQTTPAVAFLTVDVGAAAGAVLSASHNPPEYNGIKLFGGQGYKLPDDLEDEIERALATGPPPGSGAPGSARELPDADERYLAHLVSAAAIRPDGPRGPYS